MHAPTGAQPVFQAYPVPGVPYYQNYAGSGTFFQHPHNPMDHFPSNLSNHSGQKMQSFDGRDGSTGSETWELDKTRSLEDMGAEVSHNQKLRKKAGGSNKKQSGVVVIRNINYITSKENKSGSESNTDSESNFDTEDDNFKPGDLDKVLRHHKRSSISEGNHVRSVDKLNLSTDGVANTTHDGNWQAFQNCLLRGSDEDDHAGNEGMFAMEKDVIMKRRSNTASIDEVAVGVRETVETQDTRLSEIHRVGGVKSCRPLGSGDDAFFYRADHDYRGSNYQTDNQFAETNDRKMLCRTTHEDFVIGSQQNQEIFRNSLDPLALNRFDVGSNKIDRESTHVMADESFIVPVRSVSISRAGQADRAAIDVDSEIPLSDKNLDSEGNINRLYYEPDQLSLIPERGTENRPVGYDPALDYEMQVFAEGPCQKGEKDVTEVKGGLRNKDRRSKVTSDSAHKQRIGGPLTKGRPSKMSPSEDARVRAERLRSYKADLQKMKKEQVWYWKILYTICCH